MDGRFCLESLTRILLNGFSRIVALNLDVLLLLLLVLDEEEFSLELFKVEARISALNKPVARRS